MKKLGIVALAAVVLSGCAMNVDAAYPHPRDNEATGRIIIKFTEAMENVNVEIDGTLVAEDAHTKRVVIKDVPVGEHTVTVSASGEMRAGSSRLEETVTIEENRDETLLIETPPRSSGYWALVILLLIPLVLF